MEYAFPVYVFLPWSLLYQFIITCLNNKCNIRSMCQDRFSCSTVLYLITKIVARQWVWLQYLSLIHIFFSSSNNSSAGKGSSADYRFSSRCPEYTLSLIHIFNPFYELTLPKIRKICYLFFWITAYIEFFHHPISSGFISVSRKPNWNFPDLLMFCQQFALKPL